MLSRCAHWSRRAQKHAKLHYPRVHAMIWLRMTKNWYITDCYVQLIFCHTESNLCMNSRVMEFRMFLSSIGSVCGGAVAFGSWGRICKVLKRIENGGCGWDPWYIRWGSAYLESLQASTVARCPGRKTSLLLLLDGSIFSYWSTCSQSCEDVFFVAYV